MKKEKIIFICCLLFSVLSCIDSKKVKSDSDFEKITDDVRLDSIKKAKLDNVVVLSKEELNSPQNCGLSFDVFFEEFARDSVFQKSRVKFPLEYFSHYYDFNLRKDTIKAEPISFENYYYYDFTKDREAIDQDFDKYTVHMEKSDVEVLYKFVGYDNGIMVNYRFKKKDNCWLLVEIIDKST